MHALVRAGAGPDATDRLRRLGADVVTADLSDVEAVTAASAGASCVVSALSGLRDVIIGSPVLFGRASTVAALDKGSWRRYPS